MKGESRREFLVAAMALWQAASLRAQQQRRINTASPPQVKGFLFLDPRRREILRQVMARIVPADERSTGAVGAEVDEYIDFVLYNGNPTLQGIWRKGLDRYGVAIQFKADDAIDEFLAVQSRHEFSPRTEDDEFFVYLKTAVAEGFYTSEEGISKELGYEGMTFEMNFPGCTHAEHRVPADYKPLLRSVEEP